VLSILVCPYQCNVSLSRRALKPMVRQMQWRAGRWFTGDEAPARDVIAGIKAVEAEPHAFQFFGTKGLQRFFNVIARTPRSLFGEQAIERRIGGHVLGVAMDGHAVGGPRVGKHAIGKTSRHPQNTMAETA